MKKTILAIFMLSVLVFGQISCAYSESTDQDEILLNQWIDDVTNMQLSDFMENCSQRMQEDLLKASAYYEYTLTCYQNIFSGERTLKYPLNEEMTDVMKEAGCIALPGVDFGVDGTQIHCDRGRIYYVSNECGDMERCVYVGYVTENGINKIDQIETVIYKINGRTIDEWVEKYNADSAAGKDFAAYMDRVLFEFMLMVQENSESFGMPSILNFVYNSDRFFYSERDNSDILRIEEGLSEESPYSQEETYGKTVSKDEYSAQINQIVYLTLEDSYSAPQVYCTMNVPYNDQVACANAIMKLQLEMEELYPGLWTCFDQVRVAVYDTENQQQYVTYLCNRQESEDWVIKVI